MVFITLVTHCAWNGKNMHLCIALNLHRQSKRYVSSNFMKSACREGIQCLRLLASVPMTSESKIQEQYHSNESVPGVGFQRRERGPVVIYHRSVGRRVELRPSSL